MTHSFSGFLKKLWPSAPGNAPLPVLTNHSEVQAGPRCATSAGFAHGTLLSEPWFTRAVSLERKRSERSRKPFLLMLLNLDRARALNGDRDQLVHEVTAALASFMRETDTSGWYRDNLVLGAIFTELGRTTDLQASIDSIRSKTLLAIEQRVGTEKAHLVEISFHLFPEDWSAKKSGGRVDTSLYPEQRDRSTWLQSAGKRMIDIVGSALALVVLSPVLLIIVAVIRLTSRGPALFRQPRIGHRGEQFTFLKFRSMHVSNDANIHQRFVHQLIAGAKVASNGVYKIQNDPRITPVGRFLRKTSLDELPQFWNVLKGDMSLVGPRPPVPYEVDVYDVWHRRRLLIAKPGITGLWQVTGRSRTTFDEMVRLDLHYTESSSLWLDLKILLQTPMAVLAGSGAY